MVRLLDKNLDGDCRDSGELFWQLNDAQFSTVAVIDQNAVLGRRMRSTSYGVGTHRWPHEVNNTGGVTTSGSTSDYGVIDGLAGAHSGAGTTINETTYNVAADLNRDGVIDSTDTSIFTSTFGGAKSALASGLISDPNGPDNPFGYDGYVYNPDQGLYTVRFRWYNPTFGRWLERDPIGTSWTGIALYQYVGDCPTTLVDSYGLLASEPPDATDVEEQLERVDKLGCRFRPYADEAGCGMKTIKDKYQEYADYVACLGDCIRDHPDKLGKALLAAGFDFGKDALGAAGVLGDFSAALIDMLEVNPETGELQGDWTAITEHGAKAYSDILKMRCAALGPAQRSMEATLRTWLENGGNTPEEKARIIEHMVERGAAVEARAARRAARLFSGLSHGMKAFGKANTALAISQAVYVAIKELKEQCADLCDKKNSCNTSTSGGDKGSCRPQGQR